MTDMDPRGALDAAIRDYLEWAKDRPGVAHVTERLAELQTDIQNLPSPVSQGPGSVPTMRPAGTFQRTGSSIFPTKEALAMLQSNHEGSNDDR